MGMMPKHRFDVAAASKAKRLRLVAGDVGWNWGDGPEVEGSAEAIILTLSGRDVAVDELQGEGAAVLAGRTT